MSKSNTLEDGKLLEKLKTFAMQTGLPFENDVEKILEKPMRRPGTWSLRRNYYFPAAEIETGQAKYRSLDFVVTLEYSARSFTPQQNGFDSLARIHFLVEAKHTESERWWMTPTPWPSVQGYTLPFLLPIYEPKGKSIFRQGSKGLSSVKRGTIPVLSGRKISAVTRSEPTDRESLTGYQIQLIQGAAHFLGEAAKAARTLVRSGNPGSPPIELIVPILVVNRPISVLREDATTQTVQGAKSVEELCSHPSYVMLMPPAIKPLAESVNEIAAKAYEEVHRDLGWVKPDDSYFPVFLATLDGLEALMFDYLERFETFVQVEEQQKLK